MDEPKDLTSADLLMLLVTKLRAVPADNFNFGQWRCGTAKDPGGIACDMPEFQARGLGWGHHLHSTAACPRFGEARGTRAMARVLEIKEDDADYLFLCGPVDDSMSGISSNLPDSASANEVADHIEAFVRRRWPEHADAEVTA